MKFGGTSVSTLACWRTIADITRQRINVGQRPLIVCSAVARVSRNLEALLGAAQSGASEQSLADIRDRHLDLARSLGLDGETLLRAELQELERIVLGISLTREVSPPLKARVLAMGELMLTRLGAAFLAGQGIPTAWRDARKMLRAAPEAGAIPEARYLSAHCHHDPDPALQEELAAVDADVLLTQGFIASDGAGRTVLLGWGGSDTSAAYLASMLQAERLEVWSNVPGMFAANPHIIPSARLLQKLDYDEAQELASTGADLLHPRSIDPLRSQGIPLHIRCTDAPHIPGTVIAADVQGYGAQVKAISARSGVMLIAMETPRMWHQVGFLARAFRIFERHSVSVDLVATSETNVTVTIDPIDGPALDPATLEALLAALNGICEARQIGPCAAVSLVGRHLRSVLHELGPALEALDQQQIYLVSQAASDLNLTFVVAEDQAERIVDRLHAQIFSRIGTDDLFGPSYRELFAPKTPASSVAWWRDRRDDLLALADEESPRYVYDTTTLQDTAARAQGLSSITRCFYAMKACDHPGVLRLFYEAGLGFECVSPGELAHIRALFPDLDRDRILFTPNFAPAEEYACGFAQAGHVTLDNVRPLELWPDVFSGQDVIVRIDPGRGHGHHKHVRTAGVQSKFGVAPSDLPRLRECADQIGARIVGLHAHVGSGILTPSTWSETAFFLASLAEGFTDVRFLNIGGGFGVPERPGVLPLDAKKLDESLALFTSAYPELSVWIEPGRYLVAEAGVLLTRVTQIKRKGRLHYVGVETGMNSLIRPALYGSYHKIYNLTNLDAPATLTADIVGPICETGDILGRGRRLPATQEGDVLLIATAGAYARVMSSRYNLREPARETLLPTA